MTSAAESERLTQGQWLRYLGDTFRNKGEAVLQPGTETGFEKRIERMIGSGR